LIRGTYLTDIYGLRISDSQKAGCCGVLSAASFFASC
jgi:hypothetical protein